MRKLLKFKMLPLTGWSGGINRMLLTANAALRPHWQAYYL
jgi:hypothetical protein